MHQRVASRGPVIKYFAELHLVGEMVTTYPAASYCCSLVCAESLDSSSFSGASPSAPRGIPYKISLARSSRNVNSRFVFCNYGTESNWRKTHDLQ